MYVQFSFPVEFANPLLQLVFPVRSRRGLCIACGNDFGRLCGVKWILTNCPDDLHHTVSYRLIRRMRSWKHTEMNMRGAMYQNEWGTLSTFYKVRAKGSCTLPGINWILLILNTWPPLKSAVSNVKFLIFKIRNPTFEVSISYKILKNKGTYTRFTLKLLTPLWCSGHWEE